MSIIDTLTHSPLLTGGIFAAVLAGWSYVKNVFRYLSAFLIRTVQISESASWMVDYELRLNWKVVPSGDTKIVIQRFTKDLNSPTLNVPFERPNRTHIYYQTNPFRIVWAKYDGSCLVLKTTQLGKDPRHIVAEALHNHKMRCDQSGISLGTSSRYYIKDVLGQDKSMAGLSTPDTNNSRSRSTSRPETSYASPANNILLETVYSEVDVSFMYERDHYMQETSQAGQVNYLQTAWM